MEGGEQGEGVRKDGGGGGVGGGGKQGSKVKQARHSH